MIRRLLPVVMAVLLAAAPARMAAGAERGDCLHAVPLAEAAEHLGYLRAPSAVARAADVEIASPTYGPGAYGPVFYPGVRERARAATVVLAEERAADAGTLRLPPELPGARHRPGTPGSQGIHEDERDEPDQPDLSRSSCASGSSV